MKRLRVGDVFTISTGDGRVGIGQAAARYQTHAYYLVLFEHIAYEHDLPSAIPATLAGPVRLLALSFDALVHNGRWPIVSSAAVRDDLPMPAYKEAVTTADHIDVVDYSGTRRYRASKDEVARLPYRVFVAPYRLELAFRASLGIDPWHADFDNLIPNWPTTRELFD